MPAKLELGPLLGAVGAVVLGVSLFLDWYDVASAWESFELVDLLLLGLALAVLLAALARTGLAPQSLAPLRHELLAAATLVLVGLQLLDPPPVVGEAEREVGAWMALGGALAIAADVAVSSLRLSVQFTVAPKPAPRARPAVDRRDAAPSTKRTEQPPPTQPMSREEIAGKQPDDGDAG